MMPATRSRLVAIPRGTWEIGEVAEIAAVALAIERRRGFDVSLPRESARYPLVCDRLSDIALELAERGQAVTIWEADGIGTKAWVRFAFQVFRWAQRQSDPEVKAGAWGLRRPFVPPDELAAVLTTLDELIKNHVSSWGDGEVLRPLIEQRLRACRAAGDSGLVECISFSPI